MRPSLSVCRSSFLLATAVLVAAGCFDSHRFEEDAVVSRPVPLRIATSATHSCALRRAGMYCWGRNLKGALGTGDEEERSEPVRATVAGADIAEIATTTGRTCVRRGTGEVACWGENERGEFGAGTRGDSFTAIEASGIHDAVQLALEGGSTCVLREDETVACWGGSQSAARDVGTTLPQTIDGLSRIIEVRGGALGTYCARDIVGGVYCWRFTDGVWTGATEVTELAGARAVAVTGFDAVCAIGESSEIRCHDFEHDTTSVLPDSAGSVVISASVGLQACAGDGTGRWRCWYVVPGGEGPLTRQAIEITSDVRLLEFAIAGYRSCALGEDQSVACADANDAPPQLARVAGLPL